MRDIAHKPHPAKFSDDILPVIDTMLGEASSILDPFAGTGKLRSIRPQAVLLEIEPEWALQHNLIQGDATAMPFKDCSFDAIATSPTYGNRMADSFVDRQPQKNYKRHTYTHYIGHKLQSNNSGAMQWGRKYRDIHIKAYKECKRVLKSNGIFVLNVSDHIRKGEVVPVSDWHIDTLTELGFILTDHTKVNTRRQRHGTNAHLRIDHENVYKLILEDKYA